MTKAPQEHAKWQIHRRQVLFSATRSVLSQPLVIPCPITHSHVRSPLKRSCSNSNSFITQLLFKCAVRHSNFEFECSLTSQSRVSQRKSNVSFQLVINFFEFSLICIRKFAVRHSNFKFECSLTSHASKKLRYFVSVGH